ncbi:MAG: response regulator [Eubacteriales bacterium]|nr:response regulator [Eubacteriales bacterium]
MISLFLVEDEMIARESIKKNVMWKENQIDLIGDAPDGEIALPQILEKRPDIVLTDIRMPFMDGLELSKIIHQKLPETKIIILSGYNEFDYARQAISLGVSDYLLKPVSSEDILCAVKKVRSTIEAMRQEKQEKTSHVQARREIFFSSLYSGFLSQTGEILNRADALSLPISAACYRVIVAGFDPAITTEADKWKTLLYQIPHGLASGFNGKQIAYLLCAENELLLAEQERELNQSIQAICEQCGTHTELLNGDIVHRLSNLDRSYQTAHLRRGISKDPTPNQSLIGAKPLASDDLLEFLRTGRPGSAHLFWEHYRSEFGGAVRSYIYRCYLMTELFFAIRKFVDEIGATIPQDLTDQDSLDRWIATDWSVDSFLSFASELCEQVLRQRDDRSGSRYISAAEAARQYVEEHYADSELSLGTVAQVVNVSPNHLSTVFKEKNSIGFNEFLTEVRIRQAKRLLITTDLRTSDIGERVGYQNMNYFSMLFKKMTGLSPSQYRRENKA